MPESETGGATFRATMGDILNHSFLALMLSIGHQTGLFDAMAGLAPSTSEEIAAAAGLNERYVREWLGAMVTGHIVTYDPETRRYTLPEAHAAGLTRAAGLNNFAVAMQFVGVMAGVEQQIVERFKEGGGLPYSAYERFHGIMCERSALRFDHMLCDVTLPLVPGLLERLRAGIDVLDVGCGSGHGINVMAAAFPQSRFVGYDFSEEGVAVARAEAAELGLTNATFEVRDIAEPFGHGAFDLITSFDVIHDQAKPDAVLAAIREALRDNGTYLMVDVKASSRLEENLVENVGPFVYSISVMHCMPVSLGLGGPGLGTAWGKQTALAMLNEAGFGDVDVRDVAEDPSNYYYIASKG